MTRKKKRKPIDLDKLEKWLEGKRMPDSIVLDAASVIVDGKKFFESHIAVLRSESTSERIRTLHEDRVRIAIKAVQNENEKSEA